MGRLCPPLPALRSDAPPASLAPARRSRRGRTVAPSSRRAMYVCRAAWPALAARLAAAPRLGSRAPLRQMSSGSVPGSSGENLIYYLCAGVVSAAGLFYGYRTVISDKKRYNERIQAIQQSNTAEWKPKPWPPE